MQAPVSPKGPLFLSSPYSFGLPHANMVVKILSVLADRPFKTTSFVFRKVENF